MPGTTTAQHWGNGRGLTSARDAPACEFALEWLDRKIGRCECRPLVLAYLAPAYASRATSTRANPADSAERLRRAALELHRRVKTASHVPEGRFVTPLSHGLLIAWHWSGDATLIEAHRLAESLTSRQWNNVAFSAGLAAGWVSLPDYRSTGCTSADYITGPIEELILCQAFASPGEVRIAPFPHDLNVQRAGVTGFSSERSANNQATENPDATREAVRAFVGLGRSRRLLSVAAVIGIEFDLEVLAGLISADRDSIIPIVERLCDAQLIEPIGHAPANRFAFRSTAMHHAAYQALPQSVRASLHRDAANLLANFAGARAHDRAAAIAVATHFAAANCTVQAAQWWRIAAMDAVVRSTPNDAVALLTTAYRELRTAEDPIPRAHWTEMCRMLGTQLATVKGNAAPEVAATYRHCLQASSTEDPGRASPTFDAVWGMLGVHLTRGQMSEALSASRQLMTLATKADDEQQAMLAHRMTGLTELLLGNLGCAEFHLRKTLQLFSPDRHTRLRFLYGSDQCALACAHLALTNALLGRADAARDFAYRAQQRAVLVGHAHTTAHVTGVLSLAYALLPDDREAAAMRLVASAVSRRHALPYWIAWADIMNAGPLVQTDPGRAIGALHAATQRYSATGARQVLPLAFTWTAEACLRLEQPDRAAREVAVGFDCLEQTGIRLFEPGLLLCAAKVLRANGDLCGAVARLEDAASAAARMRLAKLITAVAKERHRLMRP